MNSKVGASRLLQTCFAVSHPWNTSRQCLAMYLKIFMYLHCYNTGKNLFLSCTEMQEILKRDLKQGVYLHRPLHIGQDIKTRFYHKFYTQRELKTHEVLSNWNYTTMYIYICTRYPMPRSQKTEMPCMSTTYCYQTYTCVHVCARW